MSGDLETLTLLLSAAALGIALVSLFMSVEIARRTTEAMRARLAATETNLNARIAQQEKIANGLFDTVTSKVGEIEKTVDGQSQTLREIGESLDQRVHEQQATVNKGLAEIGKSITALETKIRTQGQTVAVLRKSLQDTPDAVRRTDTPADELATRDGAATVVASPMPAQPVIRDVEDESPRDA